MKILKPLLVIAGLFAIYTFAARYLFRGPGNDVLLPPGTPPDWRERAKRNAA